MQFHVPGNFNRYYFAFESHFFFTIAQLCQINFSYISRPNAYFNGQYDIRCDHRLMFVMLCQDSAPYTVLYAL